MTEKTLEFEGGTAGDTVSAGAGNVSGLNLVNLNGGQLKYDPAAAFYGSLGIMFLNVAGQSAVAREFIDAPGATLATSATKMSYTYCVLLPSSVPAENETFWSCRLLPSSAGPRHMYYTDGTIVMQPSNASATIVLLSSAERASAAGRWLRCTVQFDASSPNSMTAALYTVKFYDTAGNQVGTTKTGTINVQAGGAGTGMAGHEVGRIGGTTNARSYGYDHMGLNDGVLTEIPAAATRLTTPAVTLGEVINPTTSSGTNGQVTVTWAAVSGASRYDVYKASSASGTPAQGDFVLLAQGVNSPYIFTGLGAGRVQLGVKAVV